jgi:hypothetical protein
MPEPTFEDFVIRIHQLERSNRFWKSVALGAAAFLLLVVTGLGGLQHQAVQAARLEAERARAEAEWARAAEMRAREVAEKNADAQRTALQERKQHQGLNSK